MPATLVDTFTYDGEFTCAPKDFSTLALQINTKLWEEAGLTDDDIPSTWEELRSVAETTDESPERVAAVQWLTTAYLRSQLLGTAGWQEAQEWLPATQEGAADLLGGTARRLG